MKFILSVIFLISATCYSQKITADNYFDYFASPKTVSGKKLTTAWLNELEVAKILKEEMEASGFEWLSNYRIIQIDAQTYINSICYSEKSNFGFVYEESHRLFPEKENRNLKSLYKSATGNDYSEKITTINGESTFLKIKELPANLVLVMENNYWYQFTDNPNDNNKLVTKEIIIDILRTDIRKILSSVKK